VGTSSREDAFFRGINKKTKRGSTALCFLEKNETGRPPWHAGMVYSWQTGRERDALNNEWRVASSHRRKDGHMIGEKKVAGMMKTLFSEGTRSLVGGKVNRSLGHGKA